MMKKLIYIIVMLILLIGCSKENNGEHLVTNGVTPTASITNTSTPTAVPTNTATPTVTPTHEPTPTLTAEQVLVGLSPEELIEVSSWINTQYPRFRKRDNGGTTIYEAFTELELDLLFRIVEAETLGSGYRPKENVASVIFNRREQGWGKQNLLDILTQQNQFKVYTTGAYLKHDVTADTIKACESAWKYDTADNCVYFNRHTTNSYARKHCEYVFTDEIGHDFFRENYN